MPDDKKVVHKSSMPKPPELSRRQAQQVNQLTRSKSAMPVPPKLSRGQAQVVKGIMGEGRAPRPKKKP